MLKLNSIYFDPVRARPRRRKAHVTRAVLLCAEPGCRAEAPHPAPKSRNGGRLWFCDQHIGAYNKAYNFFKGMSEGEIDSFQRSALWGHRPLGDKEGAGTHDPHFADPYELFERAGRMAAAPPLSAPERKALKVLDLDETASPEAIQESFKRLVKLHHPDHNRAADGTKLVQLIEAYQFLKSRRQRGGIKA